jgi:hypothetical protein
MISRLQAWMSGTTPGLRLPWRMFWVGLALRVLYITLAHTYHIRTFQDHFQFAWEVGRIARALATGYGYADPFIGHTGPTAWSPPLYPLLLAGVFKLFGVYTPASAWVILTLNSVFSAAIIPAIYEIADRCFDANGFGPRVALWSGWLWTLYPAALQYAVHWVWEMSLTTCLFAWVLVIALRVRGIGDKTPSADSNPQAANPQTPTRWAIFGILWALICMSNSSLLLFLPACGLWMLAGSLRSTVKTLPKAALAGLLFCLCLSPWVYRNWTVFHAFIPTRGNLGAEIYQSILPEHQAFPWGTTIPYVEDHPEYKAYKSMGEVAYVKQKGAAANVLIATHKKRFATYALKRVYFFWVSVPHPIEKGWFLEIVREMNYCFLSLAGIFGLVLALKRRVPGSWLFAWTFLLVPVAYYLVTVQARFRHPLEPLITILAVFLFQSATPRRSHQAQPIPATAGELNA